MDDSLLLLKRFFNIEISSYEWDRSKTIPLYLSKGRQIRIVNISDISILLVSLSEEDKNGVRELKSQRAKLQELSKLQVVFDIPDINRVKRDALIDAGIEFISVPDQIYMPSLGIMLKSKRARFAKMMASDKLSAAAQQIFLFLLYKKDVCKISKGELVDILSIPSSTITRATAELNVLGLINSEVDGRKVMISATAEGIEYYNKARAFLINPVQDTFFVDSESIRHRGILSGENVLAKRSDLAGGNIETMAYYKKDLEIKNLNHIDEKWEDRVTLTKIELWKYNPAVFADDVGVDPVSLACTLENIYDERLEDAINQMLEEKLR